MNELICIENCEPDILQLDNELNGNTLLINDVPSMQELSFSERLEIDEPMAVWFKCKGMWHAGIKCATHDLPLSTQKDKPVHDNQNKYLVVFSPVTKDYSWVNIISVQSIDEFPEPIAYETHQDGLNIVQDLTIARRFTMKNLVIEMIDIVEQIHSHALIEDARDVMVWKQFAMDASDCQSYSDLGRMVQRLQKSILQHYINADWKLHCSKSWVDRCKKAKNAEIIKLLNEELVDSVLWNDVKTLWNVASEPKLGYVWKTWKHDVMKWFSRNSLISSSNGSQTHASSSYGLCETSFQAGFRRPKLQVRRPSTPLTHTSTVEVPVETEFPSQFMNELSDIRVEAVDYDILPITEILSRPMDDEERPVDDEERAVDDEERPVDDEESPVDDEEWPVDDEEWPVDDKESPVDDEERAVDDEERAVDDEESPADDEEWPADDEKRAVDDEERAVDDEESPADDEEWPVDDEEWPVDDEERPVDDEERAVDDEERPADDEEWPVDDEERAEDDEEWPVDDEERAVDDEERPVDDEEAIELFAEPNNTKSRQCEMFIEAKGRQCRKTAIVDEKYCCAHISRKPEKQVKAPTPMCGATTVAGTKCKHHSLAGFSFCKKHLGNVETNKGSNSHRCRSKRKAEVKCRGSTLKRRVHRELVSIDPKSAMDVDPVSIIRNDAFIVKNILGETLTLSGSEHNEIEALQLRDSPGYGNDNDNDNDNEIRCKICFEEFRDDQSVGNHWMENHEREAHWLFMSYACAICLDSFTNKKLLESHVQNRHHVQFIGLCLLLQCNACGANFGDMDEFWSHVKSFHRSEFKVSKAPKQLTLTNGDDSLDIIEHRNEASLEEPQPSNLNILSIASTSSCEVNLEASLKEKYGYLPERLCLQVAEDSSEREILENSHQGEIHSVVSTNSLNSGLLQKALVICDDISFGKESTPVICVLDQEILNSLFEKERYVNLPRPWEGFSYVTNQMLDRFPSHNHEESLQLRCSCSSSTCCRKTCDHIYLFDNGLDNAKDIFGNPMRGKFPYNKNGQLILKEGYSVYECNDMCRCSETCQNRVLRKGIKVKLEVFKTKEKGWGVRAGEDILRGTFVCEYIGEVVAEKEILKRLERYEEKCEYFYDIGAHDMSRSTEGHARYVIDSTRYGNVSRFINTSRSPNLANYQVFIESMNIEHAHIGLYANRDIALGEELTYSNQYKFVAGEGYSRLRGPSSWRKSM